MNLVQNGGTSCNGSLLRLTGLPPSSPPGTMEDKTEDKQGGQTSKHGGVI